MNLDGKSTKDIGILGERVAKLYLQRHDFKIVDLNVRRKMGEIDIIAKSKEALHFIEVKAMLCVEFPESDSHREEYDPSLHLYPQKIRKVARMGEWYVAEKDYDGEWQVDAVLVWLRKRNGKAFVRYLPQLV